MQPASPATGRPTFPWLYALPSGQLPETVECRGTTFRHSQTFKHDFFAATGLYQGPHGPAVLKVGRVTSLLGIPLAWIGRLLRNREARLYELLQDLPGVPAYLGSVGATGFLHAFVPGHPLGRNENVSDEFFPRLQELLSSLHQREVAYVDLNKRQNILAGDDGRPYLIDFQISYQLSPRGLGRNPLARWLLRRLQIADRYHFCKHKRRLRPDQLSAEERVLAERVGFWIRLHRAIARPLIQTRRALLRPLRRRERMQVAGSGAK